MQKVIRRADEISQEFRRAIHVDMAAKRKGRKLKLLKELLEADNMIRDVIANLRKATSIINVNSDKEEILRNEQFLEDLYANLTAMFESFDRITTLIEFDQEDMDGLVINTIDSIDRLSNQ